MIDIHSHILHDIDDGAADLMEAVLMAELAAEGGTEIIIATPHGNVPKHYGKQSADGAFDQIEKRRDELAEALKERGTELEILLGMEIFAAPGVADRIRKGELREMPGGRGRYMIEFDFFTEEAECNAIIDDVLKTGAKPIIAHPERYICVQRDHSIAAKWADMGCELQINAGGVMGKASPEVCEAAAYMLDNDLVTYVASDAHDPYYRTPYLRDVYELLKEVKGAAYAEKIMHGNARDNFLKKNKR